MKETQKVWCKMLKIPPVVLTAYFGRVQEKRITECPPIIRSWLQDSHWMEHSLNVCFHHEILWAPVLSSSVFCTFECIRKRTSVLSWFSCGADGIMIAGHGRQFSSVRRELLEWNQGAEAVLFVLTVVLRYNLYTIKSIHFKDATQWVLVNLQRYISITVQFYSIPITSERTLVPICCHSLFCFTPAPRQPLFCFLSQ